MGDEVREGLLASPKRLPSKYFYDARGAALFDRITELPEYYLTRAEESLLARFARELIEAAGARELVEIGPGSGRKTRRLLDAMEACGDSRRYVPFDASAPVLEALGRELLASYPSLEIDAVAGDFGLHLDRIPAAKAPRLVAFLGSTIGNLVESEAAEFLASIARVAGPGGRFLLGTDLVKDRATLEAAYDDSAGVTAEFNRNLLRVVNERLGGDFDPEAFEHVAFYDEAEERVEMHLASVREQRARLERIAFEARLRAGERIRTEVCCKYTRARVERMLRGAGLALERWIPDEAGAYALSLSRVL